MFTELPLSREESWLLGFFHTDGSYDGKRITFELTDKDVIEKLHIISGGGKISQYNRNDKYVTWYYRFSLDNSVNYEKLKIFRNKTFNLTYPEVGLSFPDYFRGVIEGDGYFGRYKQIRGYTVKFGIISASPVYIYTLQSKLLNLSFETNIVKRQKKSTLFSLQKAGETAINILDYIYNNTTENIRMNRKYLKYLEIKNQIQSYKSH